MIPRLRTDLLLLSDSIKAGQMKAYMKNHFDFLGVQAENRRFVARTFIESFKTSDFETIKKNILKLWAEKEREFQLIAMDLFKKHLGKITKEDIYFIEKLIITKSWWDTVDWIAVHAVGKFMNKYPENKSEIIGRWSDSDNIWLIRSCLLFQMSYKSTTDLPMLESLILKHCHTKEFFINKAIGWALREYAKTNRLWVIHFVDQYQEILSPLSIREALLQRSK